MRRGFTLVEVMIVISMIAVIASFSFISLNKSREKARDAVRAGDLTTYAKAAEVYFSEHFYFPANEDDKTIPTVLAEYYTAAGGGQAARDPSPDRHYYYMKTVPANIREPKGYCLGAMMENDVDQNNVTCGLEDIEGVNYQVKGP